MYDNEFEKDFENRNNQNAESVAENIGDVENVESEQDTENTIETENVASDVTDAYDNVKTPDEIPPEVFEMRSEIPLEDVGDANESQTPSETAEIVYDADKKTGNYSCNFVENDTSAGSGKKNKNGGSSTGIKIAALIIAAAFTLTCMAYVGFTIADEFFDTEDIFGFDNGRIPKRDDIFQMERPDAKDDKDGDRVNEIVNNTENLKGVLTVGQIAEKCKKSSVGIMIEKETYYFGRAYKTSGVGSGFILSEDGYIATNSHVVDGASTITVMLDSGESYEAALVGKDPVTDIAVVKIEASGLPVMERGNSDEVRVGDIAVAIGTPASIELAGTVTDGIISAVGRKIDITDDYGNVMKTMTLIQTNATINPGNSGGPLINSYGQVIGINTLKLTAQYEGIGFAIPINGAIDIMNQLIADGKVSDRGTSLVTGAPSIGISCADISDAEAEYYGIPKGVLVIQINKASQAAQAGLRRGDIILEFEGEKVETSDEINVIKDRYKPDDVVTMKVYRDGEGELEITFKLDIKQ